MGTLGVCNATYEFTLAHIGDAGGQSGGHVYSNSNLGLAIKNNSLHFPRPKSINSSDKIKHDKMGVIGKNSRMYTE